MAKPLKALIAALVLVLLLGGAGYLLLAQPQKAEGGEAQSVSHLVQKTPQDVASVTVQNTHGSYTAKRSGDGVFVEGIPAAKTNTEYVDMLLDEASDVQYLQRVTSDLSKLADYGLAKPEATVDIAYKDGGALRLLIGAKEPISGDRYFMQDGAGEVLLMKNNRSIRFTMSVEKYIDFIIIPPEAGASALNEIGDIRFSGVNFPEPIALRAMLGADEALTLSGLSFGAFTHLIVSPGLYEGNANALTALADQMLGLLSEEIVAYNCNGEQLAAYGFDAPFLRVDFDYKNGEDAPVTPYTLRVAQYEGGYIATVNDEGVVYKIIDQPFLHFTYDDLILRWFVSPLIPDVSALTVADKNGTKRYELSGEDARDMAVTCDGAPVDAALFRRYYNLATSAAANEGRLAETPALSGEPLLTLRYSYRSENKADDVLEFYPATARRVYVRVNGACEFTMRENFLPCLGAAGDALARGETFATDW